jgi:hypothetical protein
VKKMNEPGNHNKAEHMKKPRLLFIFEVSALVSGGILAVFYIIGYGYINGLIGGLGLDSSLFPYSPNEYVLFGYEAIFSSFNNFLAGTSTGTMRWAYPLALFFGILILGVLAGDELKLTNRMSVRKMRALRKYKATDSVAQFLSTVGSRTKLKIRNLDRKSRFAFRERSRARAAVLGIEVSQVHGEKKHSEGPIGGIVGLLPIISVLLVIPGVLYWFGSVAGGSGVTDLMAQNSVITVKFADRTITGHYLISSNIGIALRDKAGKITFYPYSNVNSVTGVVNPILNLNDLNHALRS